MTERVEPVDTVAAVLDETMPVLKDLDPDERSRWSTAALLVSELEERGYRIVGPRRGKDRATLALRIANRMAQSYSRSTTRAADVAKACDEVIDPSGNLLGWLREYANDR